jgi:DNA-binding XRE family transcriptional regulator
MPKALSASRNSRSGSVPSPLLRDIRSDVAGEGMVLIVRGPLSRRFVRFEELMVETRSRANLKSVGMRIRSLRQDCGISQEAFAAQVGLDRSYYGAVERGQRNISLLNLIRIAAALQVEVGALFPPIRELKRN